MTSLSFMGKKTRRDDEAPYATFVAGSWTWQVLKSWQKDESALYARWFCRVVTPMTGAGGDMGDVYVRDILVRSGAKLAQVDGREPTADEAVEVNELRHDLFGPERVGR